MSPSIHLTPEQFEWFVPLGSLRAETRADLAGKSTVVAFKAGERLFRIGDETSNALYLLEGELELRNQAGATGTHLRAGSPEARYRIAHQSPRQLEARCATDVRCLAVDARLVDVMLTWDQTGALEVGELGTSSASGPDDWMTRLLQTPAFQMVPPANLQAIFMRMERLDAAPGQIVVRQDEPGDYFYVIAEGRCMVTREQPRQKALRLAELESGSCFGEEALIADSPRSATVTMLTRGSLMRLAKEDFRQLLNEPLTCRLSLTDADAMVESGRARYLDVRLPSEFGTQNLAGSINVPLYMLRMRLAQLSRDIGYICVCDTGRRSSVASFVLAQKGYEAYLLARGLDGPA